MRYLFIPFVLLIQFFLANTAAAAPKPPEGMAFIKGGCYMMGTDESYSYEYGHETTREQPAHKVCLDNFFMDTHEVNQKKWNEVMDANNAVFKEPDLPMTHVKWDEATLYCEQKGFRLPTEAEWEYAARAGSQAKNPWGGDIDYDALWFVGNSMRKLSPVGKKKSNAWGLYDMVGSVWEWVSDWYSYKYYPESPVDNPKGPQTRQSWRVIRGASWVDEEERIRVTIRYPGLTDVTENFWVGFRCAKSAPKE